MIQGMQKAIKESWILKAFLGVLMMSFAVWGVGDAVAPSLDPNVVIKVDQVEVRAEELQRRFNQQVEQLREALGPDFTAKQAVDLGIMNELLVELGQSAAVEMAARDMGVVISNELLRKQVLAQDAFKDETGNFNRIQFNMILANNNLTEQGFVDLVRSDVTQQTLVLPVGLNAGAPKSLIDPLFLYRAEQRVAEVLYVPDDGVTLDEEPTDEDLRAVYNEAINSFTAPEYRTVSAVIVRPRSLVPPESITDEEIQTFYDENIDRYRTREKRTVSQLIFATEFEAQEAARAVQAGDTLATLAERLNLGEPIDLGELTAGDNIGFSVDPIFALAPNTIGAPVQTDFGWHLFEVSALTPGSIKALPVVRDEIIDFLVQDRAFDEMYEATVYMEDQLAAGIAVQEVASAPGFEYAHYEAVDRDGRDRSGARQTFAVDEDRFLRLAFATDEGFESQLVETDEYAFILRVEDIMPPAPKPFELVRNDVRARWEEDTRSAATAATARDILDNIGPSTDFLALADADETVEFINLGPVTRFGNSLRLDAIVPATYVSPDAMDKLFKANMGDVIEARVAEGHIVARLTEVVAPDQTSLAQNKEVIENSVKNAIAMDLISTFTNSLIESYDVSYNNEAIDELTPQ